MLSSNSCASIARPPSTPRTSRSYNDHNDGDLISFTNPIEVPMTDDLAIGNVIDTASLPSEESHENFKKIVSEIHRYV